MTNYNTQPTQNYNPKQKALEFIDEPESQTTQVQPRKRMSRLKKIILGTAITIPTILTTVTMGSYLHEEYIVKPRIEKMQRERAEARSRYSPKVEKIHNPLTEKKTDLEQKKEMTPAEKYRKIQSVLLDQMYKTDPEQRRLIQEGLDLQEAILRNKYEKIYREHPEARYMSFEEIKKRGW